MAFNNNALTARLDELRSRNPPRVSSEGNTGQNTPFRYSGSYMNNNNNQQVQSASTSTEAPSLQRRFTADMSKMPIAPIGELSQNTEPLDVPAITFKKAELLEKKRQEQKELQKRREQFQAQMEALNQQSAQQQYELEQMTQDLQSAGYQSEPTTPPEYRDQGYTPVFGRTNRYSSSSIASPPGLGVRSHRSGSQVTSPPSELTQTLHSHGGSDTMPSKSVPGSRRGSNDRVTAYVPETNGSARRNARYSMPVPGLRSRTHESVPEHSATMGLGSLNTTSFLFDDEENSAKESTTSPDAKSYLQMTDDKFPILVRGTQYPGVLSASSAALDLALSQSPGPEAQGASTLLARHRLSEQLAPTTNFHAIMNGHTNGNPIMNGQTSPEAQSNHRQTNRHSMEASLAAYSKPNMSGQLMSNDNARPSLASIHPSYSTNDVPTLKNAHGSSIDITPPKTQAQQHFHNHNASLGRIPVSAVGNRHSRELSGGDNRRDEQTNGYLQLSSALQASAAPFGPPTTAGSPAESVPGQMAPFVNTVNFQGPPYYGGYGMQMMSMGMNPMQMANPMGFQNQIQALQPQQTGFSQYANYGPQGRFQDSQTRIMQQRRVQNGDEQARFNNVQLESLQGEILGLCKDQHGCRYLQKKLEERHPASLQMIFVETYEHVVELMTDPFGNYLCQKLLEFSNNEQRTQLIHNAAPDMVKIALNSHGTRALQKMIDFIETQEQIQTVINALNDRVVDLIQDLNGNHVIQKCLNKLSAQDAEFIFSAVGNNCIIVGTHRHGCCVLQRCIDHAVGYQRAHLIKQITENAFHLVQDPFGNYVLQYIIDLQEPHFTDPLCEAFHGQIPSFSKQKFSSNVIEKCLRGAQQSVTRVMIEEMLNTNELEKMLRDSYANYVVQTAMDYGDPEIKARLIEAIRPILPAVRQTPHGRRIQSKILALDGQGRFSGSGTPNDRSSGQIPLSLQMTSSPVSNGYTASSNGFNNYAAPPRAMYPQFTPSQTQQFGNGSANIMHFGAEHQQNNVQHQAPFARMPQVNGGFF